MTKKRLWLTVALSALIAPAVVHAQDAQPDYGIKFGGFVKFDAFNDSRQVVAAREDMFLLYPAARSQITAGPSVAAVPCVPDNAFGGCLPGTGVDAVQLISDPTARSLYIFGNKEDTNAIGQTGMTAIQSRLSGKITGPDAFGAKVTGLLELDFFATNNGDTQEARLRHAWVNLDWGKMSFRAGQDWHPLFLQGGIFPGTLQFNPLAPIHPFGRAPQVAFTTKPVEGLRVSLYALGQTYHADYDTTNNVSQKPSRTAKIPELAAQADYTIGGITIGGTFSHKEIVPLGTPSMYSDATITQVGQNTSPVKFNIYQAYLQIKQGDLKIKASTTWGDNWSQLLGTGGYGFKQDAITANLATILTAQGVADATNVARHYYAFTKREYSPTKARGVWGEIAYGKDLEFGIVGGKVENLGAADEINISSVVGRSATNLKSVITIAPRVKLTSGKTMFGLEYIYSEAAYLEDDKNVRAMYSDLLDNGALDGSAYTINNNYLTLTGAATGNLSIANSEFRDGNGKINKTYTVVNHRIQLSVQQNF